MLIFSSGVNRKVMADAISTASYFQPFKKYTIPRKERRPSEGKPDSMRYRILVKSHGLKFSYVVVIDTFWYTLLEIYYSTANAAI